MLNCTVEKNELDRFEYNASGMRSFINRFTDGGFKTKWSGVWAPPVKVIEYFAYKLNGTWLSGENSSHCTIKPWGAKHHYSLGDVDVTETTFAPDDSSSVISLLTLKNRSTAEKKLDISLEAAVNIRTKEENIHDRKYRSSYNDIRRAVVVESEKGSCMFGIGRTAKGIIITNKFTNNYKNHNPGSPQCCFIPSEYTASLTLAAGEETRIPFIYSGSSKNRDSVLDSYDRCMQNWDAMLASKSNSSVEIHHMHDISTPSTDLDKTYIWAQYSLLGLLSRSDFGLNIFAGYPWFLEYWGRDIFWSLLGLTDMGRFSETRQIISTMARFQKERMPCIIHPDGRTEYHGADIDPLFLIALDDYEKKSGDTTLRKELYSTIRTSLKNLHLMDYIVVHSPGETWMDSIERPGSAVEVQALWVQALRSIEPKLSMKMNKRLNENFWNADRKTYYDTYSKLPDPEITANSLVPLMLGLSPDSKKEPALRIAKDELLGAYGIRTRSKKSKSYNASGYHTGSCWGLTTGWGAAAFLSNSMIDEGLACLDYFAQDCKKYQPGALSEVVDAETGALLGATDQAWSSSLFIYDIDDHLFGIKPDLTKNTLTIEPRIPENWNSMQRTGKIIGPHTFDLKIRKTKKSIELKINFRKEPENLTCEILLPAGVKKIQHGSKKSRGRVITIPLKKDNTIEGLLK